MDVRPFTNKMYGKHISNLQSNCVKDVNGFALYFEDIMDT